MNNKKEYNIMSLNEFQACHYMCKKPKIEGETFRIEVEYFINDVRFGAEPEKVVELIGSNNSVNIIGTKEIELNLPPERLHIEGLLRTRIIYTEESVIKTNQEIAINNMHLHQANNMYLQNNMMYHSYVNSIKMNYPFIIPSSNFPTLK